MAYRLFSTGLAAFLLDKFLQLSFKSRAEQEVSTQKNSLYNIQRGTDLKLDHSNFLSRNLYVDFIENYR